MDKTSPFHPLTTQTLTFLYKSGTPLFVTQQNLLETHRVLIGIYKLPRKQVIEKVNQLIISLKISLISPLPTTFISYQELLLNTTHSKIDIFDAYLTATLLDNDIHYLLTFNDRDFRFLSPLVAITPHKLSNSSFNNQT